MYARSANGERITLVASLDPDRVPHGTLPFVSIVLIGLLLYLLNDPRTRNLEQAEALLDEWLGDERNWYVRRRLGLV